MVALDALVVAAALSTIRHNLHASLATWLNRIATHATCITEANCGRSRTSPEALERWIERISRSRACCLSTYYKR